MGRPNRIRDRDFGKARVPEDPPSELFDPDTAWLPRIGKPPIVRPDDRRSDVRTDTRALDQQLGLGDQRGAFFERRQH
jgi:hypothetical protein